MLPPLFPRALFSCPWRCWSLSRHQSHLAELWVSIFRLLHGLVCCYWAPRGAPFSTAWTRPWNGLCQVWGYECACVMRPFSHRFVVYNTEKRSQMCEIHFVWSCPTWPSRWEMRISIDWPRLKSCQAVCDECTRGAICSGQSRDAGCFDMWGWPESCVTKIWGLSHDHGFVLFLFATMGFHIARSGIFWTPTFVL